ncbi:hypothetical protein [Streptomyces humi]
MTDHPQNGSPSTDEEPRDGALNLTTLRHLVRHEWRSLPGSTLVVLSADTEGNAYSPFATYSRSRYAPIGDGDLVGEVYPLPEELKKDKTLRELFPDIPDSAVPALVLYPLG